MRAYLLSLIFCCSMMLHIRGQGPVFDSLRHLIDKAPEDTNRVEMLAAFANLNAFTRAETGLIIAQKALDLARKLHFERGEIDALNARGEAYHFQGNYVAALKDQFEALSISRRIKNAAYEAKTLGLIGIVYVELGEPRQALQYLLPANKIYQSLSGRFDGCFELSNTGDAYDMLNMRDSALYYQREAYKHFPDITGPHLKSFVSRHIGNVYSELGQYDSALKFYRLSSMYASRTNDKVNLSMNQKNTADLYEALHENDSSLLYAREAFASAQSIPVKLQVLQASKLLAILFRKTGKLDSALFYSDIASSMKDSLYGPEKFRQLQLLMLDQQRQEQSEREQQLAFRNKIKYFSLLSGMGVVLLLAFVLLRNNRQKQKANNLLHVQKSKIESTLVELKSTQSQLIQSEKMASLGELTAGIAHEIQNPLNFVNNFSEVNKELIDETSEAIKAGNARDAVALLATMRENEEKISHHGQRADSIVKGMLLHSRESKGQKESVDINAMADEYLRLSYRGLRAKDNTFQVSVNTDFDQAIGKLNIVPQEIGRVLLNLYNNSFYAVSERKKQEAEGYEPAVSVNTRKMDGKIEIHVKDNGNGISQKILDKIFQPFFTTKPPGQGTGLGLSLSYDIIKAHGGEINVETTEGEETEFIVQLPIV